VGADEFSVPGPEVESAPQGLPVRVHFSAQ